MNEKRTELLKKPLIVTAMDVEHQAIADRMHKLCQASSETFCKTHSLHEELQLSALCLSQVDSKNEVFLMKSGVGPISTTLSITLAIHALRPSCAVLLGVAGALAQQLEVADMIVADQVVQHDSLFTTDDGDELMAPGELHLSTHPDQRVDPVFQMDRELTDFILQSEVFRFSKSARGMILSGSEFVGRLDRKQDLSTKYPSALAVEMESAAVAFVAKKFQIPVAVVKTIADRRDPSPHKRSIADDYLAFAKQSADVAARVFEVFAGA